MVVMVLLFSCVNFAYAQESIDIANLQPEQPEQVVKDAEIIGESIDARKADEKHFRLSDGSFIAAKYAYSVHYQKNGQWLEIDNTLTTLNPAVESGGYTNTSNSFKVTFANDITDNDLVKIEYENYNVTWGYVRKITHSNAAAGLFNFESQAIVAPQQNEFSYETVQAEKVQQKNQEIINQGNTNGGIVYQNIENGIDLEYKLSGGTLKENIIVNQKRAEYTYQFMLKTGGLIPVINADKSIDFKDGQTTIFKIPAPIMYDALHACSTQVEYQIESIGTGYLLTITADPTWINDSKRELPIKIDPQMSAVSYAAYGANLVTQSVNSAYPDKNYSQYQKNWYVSVDYDGIMRTYLNMDLPTLRRGDVINNAAIAFSAEGYFHAPIEKQVNIHKLTESFSPSTITWNQKPAHDAQILDFNIITATAGVDTTIDPYMFDVTKTVKSWYDGSETKYGFVLKFDEEISKANEWTRIWLGLADEQYNPKLLINYRNTLGYEDYWSYTAVNAGNSGTASVNNFNGNLYVSQPIMGLDSERAPINISLENNSGYVGTNDLYMNGGWKLNYEMELGYDSLNSDPGCSSYFIDADGTKHYFYIESWDGETIGDDEDGLGLTLDRLQGESDAGKITDKDGNYICFDSSNRLYKVVDKDGNVIQLTFNSYNGRIATITNGVGHTYTFNYNDTGASADGSLQSITSPTGKSVTFNYTNGYLSKITYPDGLYIQYSYTTDGELSQIRNVDGTITSIQYDDAFNSPVSQIKITNSDQTKTIEKYDFNYDFQITKITDQYNKEYEYQFDNFGHPTCLIDLQTNNVQYANINSPGILTETSEPNPAAHKPSNSSYSVQAAANLLDNGSFNGNTNEFTVIGSGNDFTASYDSTMGHSNLGSVKISVTGPDFDAKLVSGYSQTGTSAQNAGITGYEYSKKFPSGYTVSAYVTTSGVKLSDGNGAVIKIGQWHDTGFYEVLETSAPVYYTEQGEWVKITATTSSYDGYNTVISFGLEHEVCLGCDVSHDGALCDGLDSYTTGTVWFDDIKLTESSEESTGYNILRNANFRESVLLDGGDYPDTIGFSPRFDYWSKSDTIDEVSLFNFGATFEGDPNEERYIYNSTTQSGSKGDVLSFGGWAKAESVWINGFDRGTNANNSYMPSFCMELAFFNSGVKVGSEYVNFNPYVENWQYAGGSAVAPANFTSVRLYLHYNNNINEVSFKDAFVCKDVTAQFYDYDEDGNLISSTNELDASTNTTYNGHLPSSVTDATGSTTTYQYTSSNNISKVIDPMRRETSYEYNSYGQTTKTELTGFDFSGAADEIRPLYGYVLVNAETRDVLTHDLTLSAWDDSTVQPIESLWFIESYYESADKFYIQTWEGHNDCLSIDLDSDTGYIRYLEIVQKRFQDESQVFEFELQDDGSFKIRNTLYDTYLIQESDYLCCDPDYEIDKQKWYLFEFGAEDYYNSNRSLMDIYKSENTAQYSTNGEHITKVTDTLGNSVTYDYNTIGNSKYLLDTITDPKQVETKHEYDTNRRLSKVTTDGSWLSYEYDSLSRVSGISKNNAAGNTEALTYKFEYDEFGRQTSSKVETSSVLRTISTKEYNNKNLLSKITYGNNQYINLSYNNDNQLSSISSAAGSYSFSYDKNGKYIRTNDNVNSLKTSYNYDLSDRVTGITQTKSGQKEPWLQSSILYDDIGRKIAYTHNIGDIGSYKTSVAYGNPELSENTSLIYSLALNGNEIIKYRYDTLGQLKERKLVFDENTSYTAEFTYVENEQDGTLSSLPKTMAHRYIGIDWNYVTQSYTYDYDANGNITSINSNEYTYDDKNQLIEADESDGKGVYTYDKGGNIVNKKLYNNSGTLLDDIDYIYDSEDKLISYDGNAITYDNAGNPLTYHDGTVMTWRNGTQLASVTKGWETTVYNYNENGIRTQKRIIKADDSEEITNYVLSGDDIVAIKAPDYQMVFMYDDNGDPYGFEYITDISSNLYYYMYNAQGDVMGIIDDYGNCVNRYIYDPWGKVVSILDIGLNPAENGSLAHINPIRYRGYFYDAETGFYYLNSRYYDPVVSRFISPDVQINADQGPLGVNLYVYCLNNPVNMYDSAGTKAFDIFIGTIEILTTVFTNYFIMYNVTKLELMALGAAVLSAMGCNVARKLYLHAFYGGGNSLSERVRKLLNQKLKNSKQLNDYIDKCLLNAKLETIEIRGYFEFNSETELDLYLSVQHIRFHMFGRNRNGVWDMCIAFVDVYDFDNLRLVSELSLTNAANDLGFILQLLGMMKPYRVVAGFAFKRCV